jgi:hypothetical protein
MPEFSSLYLQASDFAEGEEKILTIRSFERKELRQGDRTVMKWVLHFDEIEAGLALNDTNGRAICKLHGKEMNGWIGRKVVLYIHPTVEYNGVHMPGIRVRPPAMQHECRDSSLFPALRES